MATSVQAIVGRRDRRVLLKRVNHAVSLGLRRFYTNGARLRQGPVLLIHFHLLLRLISRGLLSLCLARPHTIVLLLEPEVGVTLGGSEACERLGFGESVLAPAWQLEATHGLAMPIDSTLN